jgi:hypothetical protein
VSRWSVAAAAGATGLIVLMLIAPTVMREVGFWDTGEFQTVGPVFGTAHPTGYPTYVILSWIANMLLAPVGEPAFRMNLLSAILVAATSGLTVVLVRSLTGWTALGMAAGLAMATTPFAWAVATRADPHALHLALVALILVTLLGWERRRRAGAAHADRWLVAAAIVFGVAAANHSLTLILAPAIGLYVLAVDRRILRRPRLVATCAAALVGTLALLYLQLPLRSGVFPAPLVYGTPHTWDGFWYVVLAEQFRGSLVDPFGDLGTKLADLISLTVAQFSWLALLVPLGFLVTLRREPRYALLSGIAVATTVFFSASYINADISRYYLGPILIAWTWIALLTAVVAERLMTLAEGAPARKRVPETTDQGDDDRLPVDDPAIRGARAFAVSAIAIIATVLLVVPSLVALPERAAEADRSGDVLARRWVDTAIAEMQRDAIVISWWSFSTPLWYAQHVQGLRPDMFIADDRTRLDREMGEISDVIDENLGRRPVYVIRPPNEIRQLERLYRLEPTAANSLYRVLPSGSAGR